MRRPLRTLPLLLALAASSLLLTPPAAGFHLGFAGITSERPTGTNLVSADGLVLAYDMQTLDQAEEMVDFSGSGNEGTLTGTTDVAGRFGRARSFDGTSDSIDAGNAAGLNIAGDITVAARFRTTAVSGMIITKEAHSASPNLVIARLWVNASGNLEATLRRNTGGTIFTVSSDAIVTDGQWRFGAWKREGSTLTLYTDSAIKSAAATSASLTTDFSWSIGVQLFTPEAFFNGDIDEPLIFSRALSDAEIRALSTPDIHAFGPPASSFPLATRLVLHSAWEGTVTLTADGECADCTYRWDLGDGTVREGPTVTHTYRLDGLWARYTAELRACRVGVGVCEVRSVNVLIINWLAVGIVGGLFAVTTGMVGWRRKRFRVVRV